MLKKHVAFRIQQLRQDTVIHFRGGDLQKEAAQNFGAHLELPGRGKTESRGGR